MKTITKDTFELAKIFSQVNNAHTRSLVLLREPAVVGQAKDYIKRTITNRLGAIINDIKYLFRDNPEDLNIIMRDLINDDCTLQVDNCVDMMMALPTGVRDEIEAYIEGRYNIYNFNN